MLAFPLLTIKSSRLSKSEIDTQGVARSIDGCNRFRCITRILLDNHQHRVVEISTEDEVEYLRAKSCAAGFEPVEINQRQLRRFGKRDPVNPTPMGVRCRNSSSLSS